MALIGLTGLLTLTGCGGNSSPPPPTPPVTPAAIDAALAAAEEYLMGEDLVSAEAVITTLVDRAPHEPRAREMHARILLTRALELPDRTAPEAMDLFRRSYRAYRVATELDPTSGGLHQSAGVVAIRTGDDAAALTHFLAAVEHDRLNAQPPLYAAQMLIKASRYDEAVTQLERALTIDPDLPHAHASLATIAMEHDDFDEARRRIRLAREIDGLDLQLRVQEARIHRRGGAPELALQLLAPLADEQRAQLTVTEEIAAAFAALERHRDAAGAWIHRYGASSLRADDPTVWQCAVHAAGHLLDAGDRVQARLWLDQARLLAPSAPEVSALDERLTGGG